MSELRKPDHTIFNSPGTEGSVEGVDAMCYGTSISLPPNASKEHIQHYGQTMYSGEAPITDKSKDGQEDIMPGSLGQFELPDQGDQRHKGTGKGNSDPTPAMPGA